MRIVIDGDGSPVKEVAIEEALKRGLPVLIVTSFAHYSPRELPTHVEVVYVDSQKEAADYRIMQLLEGSDILITQDYGLASLALGKGCVVLHHGSFQYTLDNIERLLQTRYLNAQMRKSGKRTKGPKPFTKEDRDAFRRFLVGFLDADKAAYF